MRFPMGKVARFRGRHLIRSCGYKQKHWTFRAAAAHLDSIRRRFGDRTDRLTVYRCRHCGAWHVGRSPQHQRVP
jgi:rubrerythrin